MKKDHLSLQKTAIPYPVAGMTVLYWPCAEDLDSRLPDREFHPAIITDVYPRIDELTEDFPRDKVQVNLFLLTENGPFIRQSIPFTKNSLLEDWEACWSYPMESYKTMMVLNDIGGDEAEADKNQSQ